MYIHWNHIEYNVVKKVLSNVCSFRARIVCLLGGCVGVRVFTYMCLHVSVWLCKNYCKENAGWWQDTVWLSCHIKGTVRRKGLSFSILLVPNTTTLTTGQLHTEWLCYTGIGGTSFSSFSFFVLTSLLLSSPLVSFSFFALRSAPRCFIMSY